MPVEPVAPRRTRWRRDHRGVQSTVLFASTIAATLCSFVSAAIYTRMLGASGYGDISFVLTLWQLLAVCGTFGLLYSSSRLILLEGRPQAIQEILGTALVIALCVGFMIAVGTACLAVPIDKLFHSHVATLLVWLAPLAITLPLSTSLTLMLMSLNRMYALAILTFAPTALALLIVAALARTTFLTPLSILLIQQGTRVVIQGSMVMYLRPAFTGVGPCFTRIRALNKSYGVPVYIGSVAAVATGYLTQLAIYYWTDNVTLGYYSLSLSLIAPLNMIPNAVASSSYRSFSGQPRISGKVLGTTVLATLAAAMCAVAAYRWGLPVVFTSRFKTAGAMAEIAIVGAILGGFGDFFNRFLGAHGWGKTLRNGAFAFGLAQILGFSLVVPRWGAWGAIYATIAAQALYLLFMYVPYARFTRGEVAAGAEMNGDGIVVHGANR
jgi:O-antigen/teichoic acid export membrane protein